METFLKKIAQRIVADHPKDTDQVLVVFNNNRSKRFFIKQFDTFGQATFLPQVTAIDEMIKQLSGLEIVQNEFLLFELYKIHERIGGAERKYQTFEDFISFGELMMGDFSEIDQYMVDARIIFDNVYELKHIGEWDISGKPLTEFQKHYLEFYRSLYQYYVELRKKLLEDKKAYSGMAYRQVAEEIGTLADDCPYSAIYFVGFNALSRCEERIIGEYVRRGIGHLLTDSDIYYLEPNQVGEAGYFLNKHMQDFPELKPEGPSCFEHKPKHITIVDCPENILQCKYAGQLLSAHPEWLTPKEAESTALVLADEKLLIPTLNALPDLDKKYNVNITMGYAYADSMVHALIAKLFSLYRQHSPRGYYHSDIVEVLSDRSVSLLLESPGLRRKVEYLMRKESHIRCNHDEIMSLLQRTDAKNPERADYLFPDATPTPEGCLALLRRLATAIVGNDLLESNPKEKQCLGSLAEILDNLEELLSTYPLHVGNIETLGENLQPHRHAPQHLAHRRTSDGPADTGHAGDAKPRLQARHPPLHQRGHPARRTRRQHPHTPLPQERGRPAHLRGEGQRLRLPLLPPAAAGRGGVPALQLGERRHGQGRAEPLPAPGGRRAGAEIRHQGHPSGRQGRRHPHRRTCPPPKPRRATP